MTGGGGGGGTWGGGGTISCTCEPRREKVYLTTFWLGG